MSAPLGKRTVFPAATRPWTVQPPQTDPHQVKKETARVRKERETCLNCTLPDCPDIRCPISSGGVNTAGRGPGKPKLIPPQEFLDWAWGPMSNREWAEKCGVSQETVRRWRKDYAEEIKHRP